MVSSLRPVHSLSKLSGRIKHIRWICFYKEEMAKHIVFTYGTLKSGEPNSKLMSNPETGSAVFLGRGETINRYPLVVASQFYVPFLLQVEGKGENVEGEIYEVDDAKLVVLDELEDHPDFYRREKTNISMTHNGQDEPLPVPEVRECWVYFLPKYKPEMINLPYLKKYTSISKDHPPYVESENLQSLDEIE